MNKSKKYILNTKTGTIHIIGKCHHTDPLPYDYEMYCTVDEAISKNTRYMKNCKICFKEES